MVVEKLEHSQLKFVFDVTADEFEKALDKAFEVQNAKVQVKGFRKGKTPRSVYEKNFGVESLYDEALNVVFTSKIPEATADENQTKTFLGQFIPNVESFNGRGKDFKVSLTIDVYPEFELPAYKGVEVKAKNLKVSAKEVDEAIKALTKKDAVMETKAEQVIAKNDYATFDFVGTVDGVEFPGGKADNYELQIGSGQFIPGFEDQMIGMKADEVKDINVTFPENYQEESLAGKAAVFKVTLHEVKSEKFPRLTADYVKGLNIEGVTNSEELKANKKAELEASKATAEKDRQLNDIINKILDDTKVELPATMINERVAEFKGQYEQQAKMYNIPLETLLQFMNMTVEKFDEEAKKQATRQALFNLVAAKIIEDAKIAPTEEEVKAKAEEDAKAQDSTAEKMLQANVARYYSELAYANLVNLLLENCKEI